MELVDMQDLGSCAERRVGSTPFIRTNGKSLGFAIGLRLFLCADSTSLRLFFILGHTLGHTFFVNILTNIVIDIK